MIAVAVAVFSATAAAAQLSGGSSERTEKHGDLAPLSLRDLLGIVLVDGRTVYTPLFSGVYWDAQDLIMEDVERTEVIRGPGAALWGANAVNGVINVITRSAHDTEGVLVSAAGDSEESYRAFRFGGRNGEHLGYRLFAKYSQQGSYMQQSGEPSFDSWHQAAAGFRLDWAKDRDACSLVGNVYRGKLQSSLSTWSLAPPYTNVISSVNVLPLDRWRLGLSYSYLELDLRPGPGSLDPAVETQEGESPHHRLRIQSYLDLPGNLRSSTRSFMTWTSCRPS